MKYLISDIVIESSVDLPQLVSSSGKDADLVFSIDKTNGISYDSYKPYRDICLPNRMVWLSIGRCGNDYLLRFPDICNFVIFGDSRIIVCHSAGSSINTVQYLLLNHVIPLYLNSMKKFVLHCSTVKINDKAALFIGDSTSGKSTLAATFCKEGHKLLSDDFLLVKEINSILFAIPSYPSLRLHQDSVFRTLGMTPEVFDSDIFEYKHWIQASGDLLPYSEKPVPIKNVYLLENTNTDYLKENIELEDIKASASVIELLNNSFIIDSSDRELLENNLVFCGHIARQLSVKRLKYKKDFSILSKVRETILSDIG